VVLLDPFYQTILSHTLFLLRVRRTDWFVNFFQSSFEYFRSWTVNLHPTQIRGPCQSLSLQIATTSPFTKVGKAEWAVPWRLCSPRRKWPAGVILATRRCPTKRKVRVIRIKEECTILHTGSECGCESQGAHPSKAPPCLKLCACTGTDEQRPTTSLANTNEKGGDDEVSTERTVDYWFWVFNSINGPHSECQVHRDSGFLMHTYIFCVVFRKVTWCVCIYYI